MIRLRSDQLQEIIEHAQAEAPLEACGLLAGIGATVERVYPMENADRSETSFQLNPEEQYRVFVEIEALGQELVGIYHSHPHSPAYPSARDVDMAYYPEVVYVIVSLLGQRPEIRAFRIRDGLIAEELMETVAASQFFPCVGTVPPKPAHTQRNDAAIRKAQQ